MPIILDHSIVGQSATSLTIRKDREFAACRICGAIYQPALNTDTSDEEYTYYPEIQVAASIEIRAWRNKHNKRHSESEHIAFNDSGLTMTPEAAHKLAPFGLVPVQDALLDIEIEHALRTAPRLPHDDVETTTRLLRGL